MVARLNRVQAKRRPCEHEISRLQTLAETTEITAKPLKGLRRTTGHGPQGSSLNAHAVDANGQGAGVFPTSSEASSRCSGMTAPALMSTAVEFRSY